MKHTLTLITALLLAPLAALGAADTKPTKPNILIILVDDMIWGDPQCVNPAPSKNITIEANKLDLPGQPISLNGVQGGKVRGNQITNSKAKESVELKRTEQLVVESPTGTPRAGSSK